MKKQQLWQKPIFTSFCLILVLSIGITIQQAYSQNFQKGKVGKALLNLNSSESTQLRSSDSPFVVNTENYLMEGDYILIKAIPTTNCAALINELEELGMKSSSSFGGTVNGLFPISEINKLESCSSLKLVAPEYKPATNVGAITSQGDEAQGSALARKNFGVDGSGVKIGVLSDSYDALGGASLGVANGDLPGLGNPNGYDTPVEILLDAPFVASDEGRAMHEIIHDVAPGATHAFHTAFLGQASFADGIIQLGKVGSHIIVDDVSYFGEPFFQDGIIAQAVDRVTANGVSYFSSAGNAGRASYENRFNEGGVYNMFDPFTGTDYGAYLLHDFDNTQGVDVFQQVTIPAFGSITFSLQWDDAYASACEGCPGGETDIDLFFLVGEDPGAVLSGSFGNNIDGDPVEIISLTNNGATAAVAYIAIGKWLAAAGTNPTPRVIKYIDFGSTIIDEYATNSPTTFGHSNATGSNAVGAAAFFNTPAFRSDLSTPVVASYSSVGGNKILFDKRGNRQKAEVRRNPDFTSVDGANTSFFGFDISIPFMGYVFDDDDFPNFFGTSAAAPHAAAGAALMQEMAGNNLNPTQITRILSQSAIDMNDPFTPDFDTGYDFKTGAGLIQVDKALETVYQSYARPVPSVSAENAKLTAFPNPSTDGRFELNVRGVASEEASIQVFNTKQRLVLQRTAVLEKGENKINIDLSEMERGIYYLKVNSSSVLETIRLSK